MDEDFLSEEDLLADQKESQAAQDELFRILGRQNISMAELDFDAGLLFASDHFLEALEKFRVNSTRMLKNLCYAGMGGEIDLEIFLKQESLSYNYDFLKGLVMGYARQMAAATLLIEEMGKVFPEFRGHDSYRAFPESFTKLKEHSITLEEKTEEWERKDENRYLRRRKETAMRICIYSKYKKQGMKDSDIFRRIIKAEDPHFFANDLSIPSSEDNYNKKMGALRKWKHSHKHELLEEGN